jgi:tellurium resistance protein TerZ
MAINLEKKLGKGERFNLKKSAGDRLTNFCVGVNWGAIEYRVEEASNFLALSKKIVTKTINVDLDLSCIMVDTNKKLCDHIYSPLYKPEFLQKFGLPIGKLDSNDHALHHSGDDLEEDKGNDDGLDNEIITVSLNNVGKEDFSQIPYAKIRIYEGTPTKVANVFASYNVFAESQYSGKRTLIMGKLYKKNGDWKFNTIGDAFDDTFSAQTITRIAKSYN